MLPGTIGRAGTRTEGMHFHRAMRWAEPHNVFRRTQTQLTSFAGWLAFATIAAIAISTVKVTIQLQVQELQFRISASRTLHAKLQGERDVLNQRIAELRSFARIDDTARRLLGMIRPLPGQEQMLP